MVYKTRIVGEGRWLETLVSDLSLPDSQIDTPYNPITFEPDEVKTIAFKCTETEFVRICSALQNGSYLTYPDNPQSVYWSFLRNYEYPIPMVDCQEIADCIETTPEIQEIIIELGLGGTPEFEAALRRNALGKFDDSVSYRDSMGDCLPDNLFGAVSQMVEIFNQNNIDFFEQAEITANRVEFGSVVSTITGIDEATVFDTVFAFLGFVQDNFFENYQAAYTDELYDAMRCEIFCIALEDCELTLDTFWNWISAKMSSFQLSSIDLNQILETFILGEYVSDFTVYAFYWLQIAILKGVDTIFTRIIVGEYSGDASRLLIQLLSVSNDPDADWITLCEDCVTEDETITFDPNGWAYSNLVGTIVPNVGNPNNAASINGFAEISLKPTDWSATNVVSLQIKSTHNNVSVFVLDASENIVGNAGLAGNGTWQTLNITLNGTHENLRISVQEGGFDQNLLTDNYRPISA